MTDEPQEIQISPAAWEWICAHGHDADVLNLGEDHGMGAVTAWLDERDLAWSPVPARRKASRRRR
jgi:hypothetical protein